ncbi:hypothetical protein [Bartonella henselae]|uniref:hypothetical protein n=1 Tax=Bartonella henselae TaxID=38323 RepID=UPI000AD2EE12|nr:hypothetical protein [Bartonella henselae]MDM9997268.1 hypothetical protein [Bartonella henselae]UJM43843.1 hypothetical protein KAE73_03795 [Bartonella henselae]
MASRGLAAGALITSGGKRTGEQDERGGEKWCGSVELILKAFYSIQGALEYVALVF